MIYRAIIKGVEDWWIGWLMDPSFAKAGGLQSQGVKGEVVVGYRKSLTTQELESSGFPAV